MNLLSSEFKSQAKFVFVLGSLPSVPVLSLPENHGVWQYGSQ